MIPFDSLEDLLTSEEGFKLATITPLQRALCWVIEGKPIPEVLWGLDEVSDSFGGVQPKYLTNEIMLLCGIRCGKTLFCAAAAVWCAFTVDVSATAGVFLKEGETPRVSVVSATVDNAEETMRYIKGAFNSSQFLQAMLARPFTDGSDTVTIRHPSGCDIDICVAAMSSAGVSLTSRWCASVIFDEAPRMASEDDGKINLEQQVKAVRLRVLKRGWIMYIGSPVGAKGYVYETYEANWKKEDQKCVIVKAFSFRMNPYYWTPEEVALAEKRDPDTARTDIYAEFSDPLTQFFSQAVISQCTRAEPIAIPYEHGRRYVAVMDPAATTNAWTFGIAESADNRKFRVVYVCQWRGSKTEPLSPKAVLAEIAPILKSYKIETVLSDQYMAPAIIDLALDQGFGVSPLTITQQNKTKMYLALLARMEGNDVELPPDPFVKKDFLNVKKKHGRGGVQIVLIETPDGRHADYAAMLALLCGGYLESYDLDAKPSDAPKDPTVDDPYEALLEEEGSWDPNNDDIPQNAVFLEELG